MWYTAKIAFKHALKSNFCVFTADLIKVMRLLIIFPLLVF